MTKQSYTPREIWARSYLHQDDGCLMIDAYADPYDGLSKYTLTSAYEDELIAVHDDIARLQELNTKLLNGDEMRDTLAELREANRVIELAEKALEMALDPKTAGQSETWNKGRQALSAIQAYKGSKP